MTSQLDRLFGSVIRNKGLKATALLLATLTWLLIRDATSFEDVVRDIPLTINLPDGWAVQETSTETVSVAFRGSQNDIRILEKSQIQVVANVRVNDGQPNVEIQLSPRNVKAPRSVRALHVTPSDVALTIDRETEKDVKVEVVKLGEPPEGYTIDDFSIAPSRVKIRGPERRLQEIQAVYTQPIDLNGRIRSFSNSIPLAAPSGMLNANIAPKDVTVQFTISEQTVRRDINNVPVRILLPPGEGLNVKIKPASVNVSLKGRVNVMSNLIPRAVQAFVDYDGLDGRDEAKLPVEVTTTLPNVNVMIIDPPEVLVERTGGSR